MGQSRAPLTTPSGDGLSVALAWRRACIERSVRYDTKIKQIYEMKVGGISKIGCECPLSTVLELHPPKGKNKTCTVTMSLLCLGNKVTTETAVFPQLMRTTEDESRSDGVRSELAWDAKHLWRWKMLCRTRPSSGDYTIYLA